jgi:cytidine deaminase
MTHNQQLRLARAARAAARNAYAPFSRFKVGAAVLSMKGHTYAGCNVENSSYGLTICAERVAVFNAVAAGERAVKAIAIFAGPQHSTIVARQSPTPSLIPPCGACLQVISEFGDDPEVVLFDGRRLETLRLHDLLPRGLRLQPR